MLTDRGIQDMTRAKNMMKRGYNYFITDKEGKRKFFKKNMKDAETFVKWHKDAANTDLIIIRIIDMKFETMKSGVVDFDKLQLDKIDLSDPTPPEVSRLAMEPRAPIDPPFLNPALGSFRRKEWEN